MACRELIFSYRLDKPPRTVRNRVELLLEQIMWSGSNAWDPVRPHLGTPEGKASLEHYQNWLQGFSSFSQAIASAGQCEFDIGDDLANQILRLAVERIRGFDDQGVRYIGLIADVIMDYQLPTGLRNAKVRWIHDDQNRGAVESPNGSTLGYIWRRFDGLWETMCLPIGGRDPVPIKLTKDARLGRAYMATQVIAKVRICIDGDWLQEPYWVVKDRDHDFCRMGWAIPSDVSCEDCEVQFWESCPRMNEGQSIIIVGLNRFLEGKINKLDESGKGKVGVVGQYGVTYMPHEDFPGIPDLVDE